PSEAGRRTHIGFTGEVGIGNPAIGLQLSQQLELGRGERKFLGGLFQIHVNLRPCMLGPWPGEHLIRLNSTLIGELSFKSLPSLGRSREAPAFSNCGIARNAAEAGKADARAWSCE
ncbi:MAG TPA: hypothetical protein VL918_03110, partial [Sphingobium sp.]|nr:hypothetical protein [Sphingobium sp.]